jgi:hypothetical protein
MTRPIIADGVLFDRNGQVHRYACYPGPGSHRKSVK